MGFLAMDSFCGLIRTVRRKISACGSRLSGNDGNIWLPATPEEIYFDMGIADFFRFCFHYGWYFQESLDNATHGLTGQNLFSANCLDLVTVR